MNDYKFVKVKCIYPPVVVDAVLETFLSELVGGKVSLIGERKKKFVLVLCLSAAGDPKVSPSYVAFRFSLLRLARVV